VEGFLSKLVDPDFLDYIKLFSIVCLQETFIEYFDVPDCLSQFDAYVSPATKLSHHGRRSGGVIVLTHTSLRKFVKPLSNDDNIVCLRIDKSVFHTLHDIILVAAYVPPAGSPWYEARDVNNGIHVLEQRMLESSVNNPDCYLMICGDLNSRTSSFSVNFCTDSLNACAPSVEERRLSQDKVVNDFGRSLLSLCISFDLVILNGADSRFDGRFTYLSPNGNSTIDYCLMSPELVQHCTSLCVQDTITSKHMSVELSFGSQNQTEVKELINVDKFDWNADLIPKYLEHLESSLRNIATDISTETNVNRYVDEINRCILQASDCMKKNVKFIKRSCRQSTWFDKDCTDIKKELRKRLRKYRKHLLDEDKSSYFSLRTEYKTLLKTKKSQYNDKIIRTLTGSINNTTVFWKTINSICRRPLVTNSIQPQQWHDHFKTIFQVTVVNPNTSLTSVCADGDEFLDAAISEREVTQAIGHLKRGKAAGLDNIAAQMIKSADHLLRPFLLNLFNKLLTLSIFPKQWSESIVIPIFKGGDTNDLNNFRPISLTSVISKIFTHIINQRLVIWSERNSVLFEEQAGFRCGYSTFDNLFTLYGIIQKYLGRHRKLYAAYIDFAKAFDSVSREKLWEILKRLGIGGKMLKMLQAMYDRVSARVRCQNGTSEPYQCLRGLKQGCLASPLLFNFLVNELVREVKRKGKHGVQLSPELDDLFILLFADDVVLLSDSPIGLQNQLNVLKSTADDLGLQINLSKTSIVVHRNGGHMSKHEHWHINNQPIEIVNSYKYLGLHLSTKLCINTALQELATKGRAGTIKVIKSLLKVNSFHPKVFFKLFDSQIQPILLYGAEVWGLQDPTAVESVHLLACKKLLNVSTRTPNGMIYGETGRLPLYINAYSRCIKYWLRLTRLSESRLPRRVYEMLLREDKNGKRNWASEVRDILSLNGFGYVWERQGKINDSFIKTFKNRLVACFKQTWHTKVTDSRRYALYSCIKEDHTLEDYLLVDMNKEFIHTFTRFRLGISNINVHKFRYHPDATQRCACPFCPDEVEDEFHFFFRCPEYELIRNRYIKCCFHNPTVLYRYLAGGSNVDATRNVMKYCFFANKLRNEYISRITTL